MQELDRALAEIGDIRSRLAVGTTFQGFGAAVVATTGLMAFALGLLQSLSPAFFVANVQTYLFAWMALAVLCAAMIGIEMYARSKRIHGGLADAMLVQAVEQFLPSTAAGVMLTCVVFKFAPELLWTLPGLWQLVLALGVFASARTLVRGVKLVAGWYFVTAFVVLILSVDSLALSPWLMAVPFAAGQLLMALVLRVSADKS